MYLFAISWQSIIAGAITTLAISIVLAVLGVALGFTVVKPRSDHPASGLGTAFGVWGVISVIVSLAAGGFVAGMFASGKGAEHGFMVWATVLIVGALFSSAAVGMAVRTVGSVVKGFGSGAASVASSVGSAMGDGVSNLAHGAMDQIQKHVGLEFDADQLGDKVTATLRDTGIDSLQPDFLKDKLREAKSDLRSALQKISGDTGNYEQVISEFLNKQKARFDSITKDVDKNTAVTALMKKRDMSKQDAEEAVDGALYAYNRAVSKAKEAVNEIQQQIQDTKEQLRETAEQARITADRFASSAAKSALAAAVALILGAVVCVYAGHCGNRYSPNYVVAIETTQYGVPIGTQVVHTDVRP